MHSTRDIETSLFIFLNSYPLLIYSFAVFLCLTKKAKGHYATPVTLKILLPQINRFNHTCALRIQLITDLYALLPTFKYLVHIVPHFYQFFNIRIGISLICTSFAPYFCHIHKYVFAYSFPRNCKRNPRQPSYISFHVVSKSPVYHGSATSPPRSV